jgi:hypothetical protein
MGADNPLDCEYKFKLSLLLIMQQTIKAYGKWEYNSMHS